MELSLDHLRFLTAAFSRLVPPGVGPGAVELGAAEYVARRFGGGPVARRIAEGLDRLDALARERHGVGFAELEPLRQDDVLRAFEEGGAPNAGFLRMLVLLALEGSFCHPSRGGNRDGAGWRFAGIDPDWDPSRCRAS
jgi:hypothetical protein